MAQETPEGMSYEEIATVLGDCTPEDVQHEIKKTLQKLRGRYRRGHFEAINQALEWFLDRND